MAVAVLAPIGRTLAVAAALLTFVVLVGATYQGVATALERRRFPYPGRLVDAGGHQLHIHCTGEGLPTVVLEAPAAGLSAAWGLVQPPIAEVTRVCSYDRAGLGWSEAGDLPYDPARVPAELQMLLDRAGERAPFVIAGQGLGAAFARLFAGRFPQQTAALVLIDDPLARTTMRDDRVTRVAPLTPWLARIGLLRVTGVASGLARSLPGEAGGAVRAFLNRPDHLTRAAREIRSWDDVVGVAPPTVVAPIYQVSTGESSPVTFIEDAASAERVTRAILDAVLHVRRSTSDQARGSAP